jgi:hypothetical protein
VADGVNSISGAQSLHWNIQIVIQLKRSDRERHPLGTKVIAPKHCLQFDYPFLAPWKVMANAV